MRYSADMRIQVLSDIKSGRYSVKEAAAHYGVGSSAIYKWVKADRSQHVHHLPAKNDMLPRAFTDRIDAFGCYAICNFLGFDSTAAKEFFKERHILKDELENFGVWVQSEGAIVSKEEINADKERILLLEAQVKDLKSDLDLACQIVEDFTLFCDIAHKKLSSSLGSFKEETNEHSINTKLQNTIKEGKRLGIAIEVMGKVLALESNTLCTILKSHTDNKLDEKEQGSLDTNTQSTLLDHAITAEPSSYTNSDELMPLGQMWRQVHSERLSETLKVLIDEDMIGTDYDFADTASSHITSFISDDDKATEAHATYKDYYYDLAEKSYANLGKGCDFDFTTPSHDLFDDDSFFYDCDIDYSEDDDALEEEFEMLANSDYIKAQEMLWDSYDEYEEALKHELTLEDLDLDSPDLYEKAKAISLELANIDDFGAMSSSKDDKVCTTRKYDIGDKNLAIAITVSHNILRNRQERFLELLKNDFSALSKEDKESKFAYPFKLFKPLSGKLDGPNQLWFVECAKVFIGKEDFYLSAIVDMYTLDIIAMNSFEELSNSRNEFAFFVEDAILEQIADSAPGLVILLNRRYWSKFDALCEIEDAYGVYFSEINIDKRAKNDFIDMLYLKLSKLLKKHYHVNSAKFDKRIALILQNIFNEEESPQESAK